jgi:hypothetical protein
LLSVGLLNAEQSNIEQNTFTRKNEMSQVPETIGGAIPEEAILDAERENGFLPPKLPEWKCSSETSIPRHEHKHIIQLTPDASINMYSANYYTACLYIVLARDCNGPTDPKRMEREHPEILRTALRMVEESLITLRALVAADQH